MGAKSQSGVWQRIVSLIPPHEVFIEPFLGSGAIMRKKSPASENIGRDLATPILTRTAASLAKVWPGARFDIRRGCGIEYLETYPFTGREFVYADPPYVLSTRSNKRYDHELTDADHSRLLRVLRSLPCAVMLSGYPSDLYRACGFGPNETLFSWNCDVFQVMTRGHTWATECLWMNYARPAVLHDHSAVGNGWRDRQRIARKRRRWVARLEKLPDLERSTLFAALVDVVGRDRIASELARLPACGSSRRL